MVVEVTTKLLPSNQKNITTIYDSKKHVSGTIETEEDP